jgi:hypothetical protein
MTYETCLRLAEHCRKMKDEAGALMYEEKAKRHAAKKGIKIEETKSKDKK